MMVTNLILSLALLLPQITLRDVTVRAMDFNPSVGACSVPDETDEFLAVWRMEEATSATRANSVSGGSAENLLNSGSVEQSTTHVEGTYSAHFTEADTDHLYCAKSTCTALDFSGSTTVLGWYRKDNDDEGFTLWDSHNVNTGMKIRALYGSTPNDCLVGDGSDQVDHDGYADTTANTWYHIACSLDAAADKLQLYLNGKTDCLTPGTDCADTQQDKAATSASNIFVGRESTIYLDGHMDEWAVIDQALSPAELCHICSCGISNWRGCSASGGAPSGYATTGVNSSLCQSCTLPTNACDPIQ